MTKQYKVIHKKSNVMVEGSPKLPAPASMEYGELAINYAAGGETLSIKNANDDIVTFPANAIKGITYNGSAVTVTNGVAAITAPSGLPAVTSSDNGKVLMVVNGEWTAANPVVVYSGNAAPESALGNDGDIYLQTS